MKQLVYDWTGGDPGFGDALPSWAIAVYTPPNGILIGGIARVPTPGDLPMRHLRWAPDGTKFAGQSDDGWAYECIAGKWVKRTDLPKPYGPAAVIYDNANVLHVIGPPTAWGYRYVRPDNSIVSCTETYADPARRLFQYTEWPDLAIGQGDHGGVVVRLAGEGFNRSFAFEALGPTDDSQFITANRDGDEFAITVVNLPAHRTTVTFCTLAELRALPRYDVATPAPGPIVVPVPNPQPEPTPVSIPNQIDVVKRVRAKYPTPLGARHWEFLVEVAQALGAELFRKDGGDNILIPALGVHVNQNIVGRGRLGDWWVDILGDAEDTAEPGWDAHEGAAGEYIDVSHVVLPAATDPVPEPEPAPVEDDPLAAFLETIAALTARVEALEQAPPSASPDLSGYAKHGDPVSVSGKVELIVFGQRLSRTVVSTGTL